MRTPKLVIAGAVIGVMSMAPSSWIAHPAHASPAMVARGARDHRPSFTQLEFGMLAGSSRIGNTTGPNIGLALGLGRNYRNLYIQGEYDYFSINKQSGNVGRMNRFGLTGRYSFMTLGGRRSPIMADFWLEAGGGRQFIAYDVGGKLQRNDVVLGVGAHLLGTAGRKTPDPNQLGLYIGLRGSIARSPEVEDPMPTCGGPCDEATTPPDTDFGLYFHLGMTWGR